MLTFESTWFHKVQVVVKFIILHFRAAILFTSIFGIIASTHVRVLAQSSNLVSLSEIWRFQPRIGAGLYVPAESYPTVGSSELDNLPNYNFRIGFDYDFRPAKTWSAVLSGHAFRQPVANARISVTSEDIGAGETEGYTERFRLTSPLTFQLGLALKYQTQISNTRFLEFRGGTFFHFLPEGSYSFGSSITTSNGSHLDLLNLETTSRQSIFKNGYSASMGLVLLKESHIIKFLVSFSFYRRTLVEGFYEFPDLRESGYSAGNYTLSGNHFSFGCAFSWVRDKHRTKP